MKIAGLHVRKSNSKLIITRVKSAKSVKSVKANRIARKSVRSSARNARNARSTNGGYHLAMLAISAVIVFELIAISSNFSSYGSFSTTGYAVGKQYQKPSYEITTTFITNMESCENVLDSNSPLISGYVNYIYNNKMGKAADSCIDSNTLLEYSCNVYGQMISDVVKCGSGCLKEGLYGYCA
ncbi:hypothetical protein HYZ41_03775 [archaeon]|nr:hypothetical protein [archaeon]